MDGVYDFTDQIKYLKKNAKNWSLYALYMRCLLNGSMSRFTWDGFPDELKGKDWYIEKKLMTQGLMALAKEPETGKYIMLPALPIGGITLYGESPEYQLVADNGLNWTFKRDEIALCYDNKSRMPITGPMAYEYANRMADIQRTGDVRLVKHKKPLMWKGPRKVMETIRNMEADLKENSESVIIDDEMLDPSTLNMNLNNDVTFIQRDLVSYKQDLMGEYFMFQGINCNPANGKKERLVSEEQMSNNEQILVFRDNFLKARQDFCEEANRKFGLDIKCEYTHDTLEEVSDDDLVSMDD